MTGIADLRLQIAVLAPSAIPLDELKLPPRIEWLTCLMPDEDTLEFRNGEELLTALDFRHPRFDLPGLVALIVIDDERLFRHLQQRWARSFPQVELGIKHLAEGSASALLGAVVACLADDLVHQRMQCGNTALDLSLYRREFERLQHSFSQLEAYASEHSLQRPIVLFDYGSASPQQSYRPRGTDAMRLLQNLPVNSLGVAGFALAVDAATDSRESISFRLFALETDQTFAVWSIAACDISVGWLQLNLNCAIDIAALSLIIAIDIPTGVAGLAFTLAPPHPYHEYRARIANGDALPAPLTMRVYGSLPGVRVPASPRAWMPTHAPIPTVSFVPEEIYNSVRQVYPPSEGEDSLFVIYDPGLGSITVHPPGSGAVTAARLDVVAPEDAWRLSARIGLAHELAQSTEFGLIAMPFTQEDLTSHHFQTPDGSCGSFSGWVRLAALETSKISVFFPKSERNRLSIYLLTRQAPDLSPDFAWARFEKLEFNSGPPPLGGGESLQGMGDAWAPDSEFAVGERPDVESR